MRKKCVLIITDGIGKKPEKACNAFFKANKPTYNHLFQSVPYGLVTTHGLSVGLPEGQMGNSEVGHMTIGAGRVLYQDLVKVSLALEDGSIAQNEALTGLFAMSDTIHLLGLMSDGGVHSHIDHLIGIAKIASKAGKKVYFHLISDGRDVSPTSAPLFIDMIEKHLDSNMHIATLAGRFYTMDRDKRWERVKEGYDAITKATPKTTLSPKEYVADSYKNDVTDEFIKPVAFAGFEGIKKGDGVIVANFRSDRARQIVTALGDESFCEFDTASCEKLHVITMTEYDKHFPYPVMFKKESLHNTLAETVANANLTQLHTAETEKYAHVTFFLNGGIEEPMPNESRILIPSPQVKTYDMQPEMSAHAVGEAVLGGMDYGYDLIVVNFANGDMVGHTGNLEAATKAVEAVDAELGKIFAKADALDYSIVLTSDHGNCEEMCDAEGNILTNHTVGDVWCFVKDSEVSSVKDGGLNNIAPTVLKIMGLEIPKEMDAPLY